MKSWPHAPSKVVNQPGMWIVTAATYQKEHFFREREELEYLHDTLLEKAERHGWRLEAWAVLSNHYHFVGRSPEIEDSVSILTRELHNETAKWINARQDAYRRQVWYRAWGTRLTFEKSYLARLSYVHRNAVKHGLVKEPVQYPYCSARWFAENCSPAFVRTVMEFPIDTVNVYDDY